MARKNDLPLSVEWENGVVSKEIQHGVQPMFIILAKDVKLSLDGKLLEYEDHIGLDKAHALCSKNTSNILHIMSRFNMSQNDMNCLALWDSYWRLHHCRRSAQTA